MIPLLQGALVASLLAATIPNEPIVPVDWLVLADEPRPGSHCDPFFARYLLDYGIPGPRAGELALCRDGEQRAWNALTLDVAAAPPQRVQTAGGHAFTSVEVDETEVWMAQLDGAESLFVNGLPFVGDPYDRGFKGVPVELRKGANSVYVTGVRDSFQLTFWDPVERFVIGEWDVEVPAVARDLKGGRWFLGYIRPLFFNASQEPVSYLHLHYDDAVPNHPDFKTYAGEWTDGRPMAPLGALKPQVFFGLDHDIPEDLECDAVLSPLELFIGEREDRTFRNLRIELIDYESDYIHRNLYNPVRESAAARFELASIPPGHLRFVTDDCYFVYGTTGDRTEDTELLARARFDAQRLWSHYNIAPTLISDDTLRDGYMFDEDYNGMPKNVVIYGNEGTNPVRYSNVVLYGNEDTNSLWNRLVPDHIEVRRGEIRCGDKTYTGAEYLLATTVLHHEGDKGVFLVGLIADTGSIGRRLGNSIDLCVSGPLRHGESAIFDPGALEP